VQKNSCATGFDNGRQLFVRPFRQTVQNEYHFSTHLHRHRFTRRRLQQTENAPSILQIRTENTAPSYKVVFNQLRLLTIISDHQVSQLSAKISVRFVHFLH
jgi:hypothetical protein